MGVGSAGGSPAPIASWPHLWAAVDASLWDRRAVQRVAGSRMAHVALAAIIR